MPDSAQDWRQRRRDLLDQLYSMKNDPCFGEKELAIVNALYFIVLSNLLTDGRRV